MVGRISLLLFVGAALAVAAATEALLISPEAPVRAGATLTVDSETDAVDSAIGDGNCATLAGECTLRAAVQEANALSGSDTIVLPAGEYVIAIGIQGESEDLAASGDYRAILDRLP